MTFDPFGDFETRGYLRNIASEKNLDIVRRLEHSSFATGLDVAFSRLALIEHLSYGDVLATHKTLFEAIYPWAGEDRVKTAPDIAIAKGEVRFADPNDIRAAIDYALRIGQDKMKARPGEVMGYLAFGHPFLDGNGRTIMVIHSVLAQRAGFSIDWAATDKTDYLAALTKELDSPGKGILDDYLKPFIREPIDYEKLAETVAGVPGLDGSREDNELNKVLGKTDEPTIQAQYEQQKLKREQG